jgi:hypothetical protein
LIDKIQVRSLPDFALARQLSAIFLNQEGLIPRWDYFQIDPF